jgi:hypothetical protein
VDDTHVVSGSGDSKLAIWSIDDVSMKKYKNKPQLCAVSEDDAEDDDSSRRYDRSIVKRRRIDSCGEYEDTTNEYRFKKATKKIKCDNGKRVRALAYNSKKGEIAAITMNARFHLFNTKRFEQVHHLFLIKLTQMTTSSRFIRPPQTTSKRLSASKENVCLTINEDNTVYAIGSASYVQLLNADTVKPLLSPILIRKDIGKYISWFL